MTYTAENFVASPAFVKIAVNARLKATNQRSINRGGS